MRRLTPDSLMAHTPNEMSVIQHSLTPCDGKMLEISVLNKSPLRVDTLEVLSPGFLRRSHTIVKHSCSKSFLVMLGCVPSALVSM